MVSWAQPRPSFGPGSISMLPGPEPAGPGAYSGGRPEPGRLAVVAAAAAIVASALVNPKLPGRTGPVDLVMLGATALVFLEAVRSRATLRMPYAVPMAGLMVTGLVAAVFGIVQVAGMIAVAQEIFLLLWCAAIATVCRTERALAFLLRTWAVSATAWAGLLIVAVITGLDAIAGVGPPSNPDAASSLRNAGGGRSRLFFDHPNMAGNFFLIGLFVVVAAGYPRRLPLRLACCAILLVAIVMTGSNAALLSLVIGALAAVFLHLRARRGLIKATAIATGLALLLGVAAVTVVEPVVEYAQSSNNPTLEYSLGRGIRSAEGREGLFESQFQLYLQGDLLGIGPTGTQEALELSGAPQPKEAHNDYLGTLVERGPLGLFFVLLLIGVVIARFAPVLRGPLPPRLAEAIPVPAALAGACTMFATTAITHEILHYRWLWTLLGIVAAVHLLAGRESDEPASPTAGTPADAARVPSPRSGSRDG